MPVKVIRLDSEQVADAILRDVKDLFDYAILIQVSPAQVENPLKPFLALTELRSALNEPWKLDKVEERDRLQALVSEVEAAYLTLARLLYSSLAGNSALITPVILDLHRHLVESIILAPESEGDAN
jgi:hypothetical protein